MATNELQWLFFAVPGGKWFIEVEKWRFAH
jgi:hypothetical protein